MSEKRSRSLPLRLGAGLGVLVVAALIVASPLHDYLRPSRFVETITTMRETVQTLWYAPLAFIGLLVLGSTCFVPVTLFVVAGAFFWGWFEGGIYSLIGSIIAAGLSFELSRYVFGDLARKLFERRLAWLHRVFDRAGIRSIMLLRLVPGIPFPVFNFGAGLTSLRSKDYLIGSAIGLSIPVFIISFSADAFLSGTLTRGDLGWRIGIAALLLAFLVVGVPLALKRFRPPELSESDIEPETGSVVN